MNGKGQNSGQEISKAEPPGEPCWVQCEGYRCLAVLNKNGKWMVYATGAEVIDFIKVIPAIPQACS